MTEPKIRYEFEPRSARQVVTDPETGKEWIIPMMAKDAWRTDHRLIECARGWACEACLMTFLNKPALSEICPKVNVKR